MHRFSTQNTVWAVSTLLLAASALTPAHAAPVTAKQANSFVGSIGIHVGPIGGIDVTKRDQLVNSGIRVLRGNPETQADFDQLKSLTDLGFKTIVALQPGTSVRPDATFWGKNSSLNNNQPFNIVDYVKKIGVSNVLAVEMNNEMNNGYNHRNFYWHPGDTEKISGTSTSPLYWAKYARAATQATYNALKGDTATRNVPILGPSLTSEAAYADAGDLSAWIDYSNIHHYMAGRHPETGGWGSNGYGSIAWTINALSAKQNPTNPGALAATEGGNATADSNSSNNQWSLEAHGKYIPRYYLTHFNAGYKWTCIYRLGDFNTGSSDPEQNFGLLKSDGTPKPAFNAVKNLTGLLADPGAAFTPGSLDYTLSGSTSGVQSTLLQKRNGKFYLCLWLAKQGWNWRESSAGNVTKTPGPIVVPDQNISITFAQPVSGVSKHLWDNNGNRSGPTSVTISGNAISLPVSDRVTVLEISSAGTGLKGQYYNGTGFNTIVNTRTDAQINFDWPGSPMSSVNENLFSVRWTGKVAPRFSQAYTFITSNDDGVRLWVNDQLLIDKWFGGINSWSATTPVLNANQLYNIKMEYYDSSGGAKAKLEWQSASQTREVVPQSRLYPAP